MGRDPRGLGGDSEQQEEQRGQGVVGQQNARLAAFR